jgi:hypothetical protein
MQNHTSESPQEAQSYDQESDAFIWPGYSVEASKGRKLLVPTILHNNPINLAKVLKPDYSTVMSDENAQRGVFSFFYLIRTQSDHCQPAGNVWWDY